MKPFLEKWLRKCEISKVWTSFIVTNNKQYSVGMWEITTRQTANTDTLRSVYKTDKPNVPVKLQLDFNQFNRILLICVIHFNA